MKLNSFLRCLFLLACICFGPTLLAQDFAIEQVNTSAFPAISVRIRPTPPQKLERAGVGVMDHGHTVDFTLQSTQDSGKAGTARAVCFLVEVSHLVSGPQLDAVKNALEKQLRGITDGAVVNICYYSSSKGTTTMKHLSNDFTSDYATLIGSMNAKMALAGDSVPKINCYSALLETMDFMVGKKNLPATKEIIFISTGNNTGTSTVSLSQCVQKGEEGHIVVDGVGLHSYSSTAADNVKNAATQIKGTYRSGATEGEIDNAVNGFLAQDAKLRAAGAMSGDTYTIRYNCPITNAGDGEVTITMGGVTQKAAYTVVGKVAGDTGSGPFPVWAMYAITGAVLLVLITIATIVTRRKKKTAPQPVQANTDAQDTQRNEAIARQKQQAEEQARKQQQEAAVIAALAVPKPAPVPPTTQPMPQPLSLPVQPVQPPPTPQFDPHRTVISGTKVSQLVMIINGERQMYALTQSSYTIGRNAGNSIVLSNKTVSGNHATLRLENGVWFVADNGSTNGTYVNGIRVIGKAALQPGMQLVLGAVACLFE